MQCEKHKSEQPCGSEMTRGHFSVKLLWHSLITSHKGIFSRTKIYHQNEIFNSKPVVETKSIINYQQSWIFRERAVSTFDQLFNESHSDSVSKPNPSHIKSLAISLGSEKTFRELNILWPTSELFMRSLADALTMHFQGLFLCRRSCLNTMINYGT